MYDLTTVLTTIAACSASIVAILGGFIASKLIAISAERDEVNTRISELDEEIEFFKEERDMLQLEYSLGQLQDVHENYTSVTTESVKDRYDGVQWTDNTATVMAYLHLLLAAGLVKPIEFSTGELEFYDVIIPTISSRDTNLKNWYLQNRDRVCIEFFDRLLGLEPTNK